MMTKFERARRIVVEHGQEERQTFERIANNAQSAINLLEIFSNRPAYAEKSDCYIAYGTFHGFELPARSHGKLPEGTSSLFVGLEDATGEPDRVVVIAVNSSPRDTQTYLLPLKNLSASKWINRSGTHELSKADLAVLERLDAITGIIADHFEERVRQEVGNG